MIRTSSLDGLLNLYKNRTNEVVRHWNLTLKLHDIENCQNTSKLSKVKT